MTQISIHVLRVEDDRRVSGKASRLPSFQSTSSVWRTTLYVAAVAAVSMYFNPRPPCGGRQGWALMGNPKEKFQSTSSVWRTTPLACMLSTR